MKSAVLSVSHLLAAILFMSSGVQPINAQQGLAESEIEGLYFVTHYGYGVGGGVTIRFDPYLLLKNGDAFNDLRVPPQDLDVAASKREDPDSWGTWQREGSEYVFYFPDDKDGEERIEEDGVYPAIPADDGETLTGTWRSLGGGGNTALGGQALVWAAKAITFSRDGRFELEISGGGSNEAAGVGVTALSRRASMGTYHLSGHVAELRYDDGRVERSNFYFFPDHGQKDLDTFVLGGSTYSADKETKARNQT